jgi:uncharacterized repeat protein (TIGR01451 family)
LHSPIRVRVAAVLACALVGLALAGEAGAATSYKQPGFSESAVFTGLTNPTVVRFLPDGRVVVAEKSGLIKLFPNISTNSYTIVADLRTKTHNFWDRGLLGLAIDPNFATNNYVYVLYTFDAAIGGTAPRWGTPGATSDPCPTPPGATTDGCVVAGHLSRLTATGPSWTASEQVILEDWCQQFPSHSIGSLNFGADGYLYVSGGDGASFNNQDWGQYGGTLAGTPTPKNPCGDPPVPVGGSQTKPTAEGGALRSQSPRRTAGEPRLLNGSILRIDPATGAAAPGNPLGGSSDPNEQRIIGYGLRNPFRMIVKPGTNDVYIADVGWNTWEEINRIPDLTSALNFGWPCFEGSATQYTGLNICPAQAQTTAPLFSYAHTASVVAGDGCPTGSSSIAGMAFYQGGSNYPASYNDALFFSDYSRTCMWVMFPDGSGVPDPSTRIAFASSAQGPVNLEIAPDGNLWYVDFDGGKIWRVKYGLDAVAVATSPTTGTAPLTVSFDGSGSIPAQAGDTLTYEWDLNGDGQYDDSTAVAPSFNYTVPGTYTVRLRVSDQRGASDISNPITVQAGNTAPTATIDTPLPTLTWKVGDPISFSGHATDPQDGTLDASSLSWQVIIHHCPSNCHTHVYQTFPGVASGSFPAPDHEYPAYLEIQLTATDAQGLTNTASVNIQPQTVDLSFQTSPAGLQLAVGTFTGAAPFVRTVIKGSLNGIDSLAPQGAFPNVWDFSSWSDGGDSAHSITANASGSYTATYVTHADLSLAASAAPEPVGAGATLTYTLTASNAGPSQASSVSVVDTLPAGVSSVSASGTGWTCSGIATVTCVLPSLGLGSAAAITIQVTAPAEAGVLSNSATVSASTADQSAANNTAVTPSNVFARADLSIGQSGAPAQICTGQPITYTLGVSNAGPSTATSISVSDVLPAGAMLVSASGTGWSCSGTTTVTCTRPSLAVGAAPAITIAIDAPAAAGSAVNAASVSSGVNDPSSANNSSSATTTVNPIPSAPAAGNNGPVCAGATLQLTAAAVAGATYAWTGPNGFTSSLQNPSISNATVAASGLYSVTVTVNGCTSPAGTTTATVRPLPTAAVSGGGTVCAGGGSAVIQAALTGTGPWTVVWSDGVTQSNVLSSPASRAVSPASTTTYTVTSVSDASCAGTASGSATVTVNPRPTAAASGTAEICAGAATPLSGSGGVSCAWSPSTGLSNPASCTPSASPAATTTYTLTVTDANGCVSNNAPSVTVTVDPKPSAAVSGSAAICPGGATTIQAALTGTAPWTVTWSDGAVQTGVAASPATRSVSPGATTTYLVTAVSDGHCAGTSSGSATVTVNPRPTAAASGSAEICAGASTPLSGSGGVSCLWAPAAGLSNPASCAPSASPAATTTYTLTVTDANGCVSNNAPFVTVTVDARPTATASGGGEMCAGGTVPIQAAVSGTAPWTVTWSDGFVQSNVAASPAVRNVSPASSTTYTVTAVSDLHCAGSASGSAPVVVHARPTAVASGTAAICPGGATPLSGSGGTSCAWSPATGLSDAASCSPTASPAATTTYNLTVTDANGCVSTNPAPVTVTVNPTPPPPTASNDGPVCAGGTLHLSASSVAGGVYAWTGPNGFSSSIQNPSIPNVPLAAAGPYSVTVSVNGCASSAATTNVSIRTVPTADVSGDAVVCQGGSTQISAALTGTPPWSVHWSDGLVQSAGDSPAVRTVTPNQTTIYTVVSVTDAHCAGAGSGQAAVTVGLPVATPVVTAPKDAAIGALGLAASTDAHDGSTYAWTVTGGTLVSGQGTASITFDAGGPGTTMLVQVAETNTACVSPAGEARVQVDFLDVPPPHIFHDYVNTIARDGVTAGCGNGNYCPDNPNTRAQMAVFLLKSELGASHVPPPATGTVFLDVPASDPFAPWIEELAALGVTGGCGGGNYCPGAPVTRAQMAVFLLKTLEGSSYAPPPATGTVFADVPASAFAAAWIEDLYARGVTGGCATNPLRYCPTNPVTRGQMSVFLTKTFGLS